jgi:hypothetical protein
VWYTEEQKPNKVDQIVMKSAYKVMFIHGKQKEKHIWLCLETYFNNQKNDEKKHKTKKVFTLSSFNFD